MAYTLSHITKLMLEHSKDRPQFITQWIYGLLHHDAEVMHRVVKVMEDNYASELQEIADEFKPEEEFEEDLQEGFTEDEEEMSDDYEAEAMYYNTDTPFEDHDLDIERDFHIFLENPDAFYCIVVFILENPDIDPYLLSMSEDLDLEQFDEPDGMELTYDS